MKGYDLDRFKHAQKGEFDSAVAELRAGRKQSHWTWYVFPQLRGLGSSPYAVQYGFDGLAEARAYLHDDVLRGRYLEALRAVHDQVIGQHLSLERLMGSHIDALKLVSSLTLFEHLGLRLDPEAQTARPGQGSGATGQSRTEAADIARLAREVLDAAAGQGFPRCAFTTRAIKGG